MLFNSLEFLVFFLVVTAGYWCLPHRHRWWWLLAASCLFYMAFVPVYIVILGATIVVDYIAGIYLEKTSGQTRKYWLYASLAANIGVLAAFKYWNWINFNLHVALQGIGLSGSPIPYLEILLPIGLSFHTFQAMSYTIEVYRGNYKAERHFGIYALYVMFYPQLVAGPIERPQHMLPQLHAPKRWDGRRALAGLQLMAWGLFKKVCVADRFAPIADHVYNDPDITHFYGGPLWIATAAFAIQIYADFSGYSDMARGAAQVMGFDLALNFNRPYFTTSLAQFWRRWHISLSAWFRDYVYIPLGGDRVGEGRRWRNLLLSFGLSGLWHGAGFHFGVWGLWHGLMRGVERMLPRLTGFVGWLFTMLVVGIGWMFFRVQNLAQARHILSAARADLWVTFTTPKIIRMGRNDAEVYLALLSLAILIAVEVVQRKGSIRNRLATAPRLEALLGGGLVTVILLTGAFDNSRTFIYFQF